MTTFMRGISRVTRPGVPMQISALRIGDLRTVCRHLQTQEVAPVDVRDRALLALSARGMSDGAISRLMWSDVTIAPQSISVRIARAGHATTDTLLELRRQKRRASCPVDAIIRWRAVAEGRGPVFTGVGRPDLVHHGLSPKGVFSVRRSRLTAIGDRSRWPADDTPLTVLSGTPSEVLRDKAVLLVGFAGAFRRVDMTRITWDDVTVVPEGLVIHLNRSKTDLTGRGRDVGIPRGQSRLTCPVRALQAWRGRVERQLGVDAMAGMPIFVLVGRSGRIGTEPLTASALTRMVKRRAEEAGLQGHWGGRSLRAGFISTAADLEIPLELIARQSRHATLDSLILYIRHDDPFRRNSASRLGM